MEVMIGGWSKFDFRNKIVFYVLEAILSFISLQRTSGFSLE